MNTKTKCIIVDDEIHCIESLSQILETININIDIIGTAQTLDDAEELINSKEPDLVFLDVHISTNTIFDLLNRLTKINFEIIFISAHNHALEAIKFMATDYLLKPININKLEQAIQRALQNKVKRKFYDHSKELIKALQRNNSDHQKIAIPTQNGYEFVLTNNILYCTANSSYTIIQLVNKRQIIASQTLKYYERLLNGTEFIRIHNSHLINTLYINSISRSDGGFVVMSDKKALPISKSRKEQLLLDLKIK